MINKNKRGQFFALYLVLLTLFMCGIVIAMYSFQAGETDSSLVSPVALLKMQDSQEIFELQEKNLILRSARETLKSKDWDASDFNRTAKEKFCGYFIGTGQTWFREFLFSNLYYQGRKNLGDMFNDKTGQKNQKNFCNNVYSFSFDNNQLVVERKPVGKFFKLRAEDSRSKISFWVYVDYIYDKKYEFSLWSVAT